MQTRREFLSTTLAGAATAMASTIWGTQAGGAKRPNVLFIIADDMNGYGFHGTIPGIRMPYLDRFKRSALTFDRAYCASPACVPSRAALFSGLYPHHTGSYLNGSDPWDKKPLDGIQSLPECFMRSGYVTFGRGKLTHAPVPPAREKSMWDNDPWGGGFGPFPSEANQLSGRFWGWEGLEDDNLFPDVKNSQAAIEFLQERHDRPFFLTLGLWRPHTPFTAPERFFEMYRMEDIRVPVPGYADNDLEDVPPLGRRLAQVWGERFDLCGKNNLGRWREFVRAYFACTTFADWSAGRVIEALEKSRYARDTIVIFWSDNGYHCGEKNHWEKTTLWEAAALTPLAIRLPGTKHGGIRSPRPVGAIDLFPTLVETCSLAPPGHTLDGRSLRPLLEDPRAEWDRPAITTYGERYFSVRDERYRYIQYPDGTEELYDHDRDPHELENLASRPEMSTAKRRLAAWMPKEWAKSLGGRLG